MNKLLSLMLAGIFGATSVAAIAATDSRDDFNKREEAMQQLSGYHAPAPAVDKSVPAADPVISDNSNAGFIQRVKEMQALSGYHGPLPAVNKNTPAADPVAAPKNRAEVIAQQKLMQELSD